MVWNTSLTLSLQKYFHCIHQFVTRKPFPIWRIIENDCEHSYLWAVSGSMPNTISKDMDPPSTLLWVRIPWHWGDWIIAPWFGCYGYTAYKNWVGSVWFEGFMFSLSLSHSSCLWGESERRRGFLPGGECVVCTWTVFTLSMCCVQACRASPLSWWREQMSGAPPVTRNYKSNKNNRTMLTLNHCRALIL